MGRLKNPGAIAYLLAARVENDKKVRAKITWALAQIDVTKSLATLIVFLKEGRLNERVFAADALGSIKDVQAEKSLIKALKDPEWEVRASATASLGKLRCKRAAAPLLKLLNDPNEEVRGEAIKSFASLRVPDAVEPCLEAFAKETFRNQAHIIHTLGELRDSRAIEPLRILLDERYPQSKSVSTNLNFRIKIVRALGKIKDPLAVKPLIKILKDELNSPSLRSETAAALANIGEPSLKPLLQLLDTNDAKIPKYVLQFMNNICLPNSFATLIPYLNDSRWEVRSGVVRALRYNKNPRAVEFLLVALKDENIQVQVSAIRSLGAKTGDNRTYAPLISKLKDSNWEIRAAVVGALGRNQDPRIEDFLVESLNDEQWQVRRQAAAALAEGKYVGAIKALIFALNDEKKDVTITANWALREITGIKIRSDRAANLQQWWDDQVKNIESIK